MRATAHHGALLADAAVVVVVVIVVVVVSALAARKGIEVVTIAVCFVLWAARTAGAATGGHIGKVLEQGYVQLCPSPSIGPGILRMCHSAH